MGMLRFLEMFKGPAPRGAVEDFIYVFQGFERHATALGMSFVPKRHWTAHIATQCGKFGSVSASATWRDEQINACLKAVSKGAHRMVWHRRVLSEFRRAFGIAAK